MRILLVGSGGREHALCWRLSLSPSATRIFCAPGNPGTARCAKTVNVAIAANDIERLCAFAAEQQVELTVVGPEQPLCAGIRDRFEAAGLALCGPRRQAAQLEGSKAFAKEFLDRHKISSAAFGVFADPGAAGRYIDAHPEALVVKADGLAAGKGVYVCGTQEEAKIAASRLLAGELGLAGQRVVIEERLRGQEASFMALVAGEQIIPLAGSQDHKAAYDGDRGPNTGGMGACSPAPVMDRALQTRVLTEVMRPTVAGLLAEGIPYQGILYAGLMIAGDQISVLEFNCRMGDPETQPVLIRLQSDPVPYLVGLARGQLPSEPLRWDPRAAVCVVLAAAGYPGSYRKDDPIRGIEAAEALEDVVVFEAGTARRDGELVTAGGRVLGVTALGPDLQRARARAYQAVERIHWEGVHYRRDIASRAAAQQVAAHG